MVHCLHGGFGRRVLGCRFRGFADVAHTGENWRMSIDLSQEEQWKKIGSLAKRGEVKSFGLGDSDELRLLSL